MAENTLQFQWIVTIKEGSGTSVLRPIRRFRRGGPVLVPGRGKARHLHGPGRAGRDRPAQGLSRLVQAMGGRGIAPQVVFEVRSPNNRFGEMYRKLKFYEEFGVDEYYLYDPDHDVLEGWQRGRDELQEIPEMNGWVSPTLGIRFDSSGSELSDLRSIRTATPGRPGTPGRETINSPAKRSRSASERDRHRQPASHDSVRRAGQRSRRPGSMETLDTTWCRSSTRSRPS